MTLFSSTDDSPSFDCNASKVGLIFPEMEYEFTLVWVCRYNLELGTGGEISTFLNLGRDLRLALLEPLLAVFVIVSASIATSGGLGVSRPLLC